MSKSDTLKRIAAALERMAPPPVPAPDLTLADAFLWHVEPDRLEPVHKVNRIDLDLLVGIRRSRDTLLANTRQFAQGLPAGTEVSVVETRGGWVRIRLATGREAWVRAPAVQSLDL